MEGRWGWAGGGGGPGKASGGSRGVGTSGNAVSFPAVAAMEPAPGPQEKYHLITRNLQVLGGGGNRGRGRPGRGDGGSEPEQGPGCIRGDLDQPLNPAGVPGICCMQGGPEPGFGSGLSCTAGGCPVHVLPQPSQRVPGEAQPCRMRVLSIHRRCWGRISSWPS